MSGRYLSEMQTKHIARNIHKVDIDPMQIDWVLEDFKQKDIVSDQRYGLRIPFTVPLFKEDAVFVVRRYYRENHPYRETYHVESGGRRYRLTPGRDLYTFRNTIRDVLRSRIYPKLSLGV